MSKGKLLLLPNVLDESLDHTQYLPKSVDEAIAHIDGLIAESEKPARVYLKRFSYSNNRTFRDIPIKLLNEHTAPKELDSLLKPIQEGQTWGLVSDCGLPCFADPGSSLVYLAKKKKIAVEAFTGPSSIVFALLLSGLSAQSFSFHGYLPQDKNELIVKLKALEEASQKNKSTQVFIEAPYRNDRMVEALLATLKGSTKLCIAVDINLPSQEMETLTIAEWKQKGSFNIGKRPAIFLFQV